MFQSLFFRLALLFPDAQTQKDPLTLLLQDIQAVGNGHTEASPRARAAWEKVVATGPAALPRLLLAMDQPDPVVANWLRTAFERIAEAELRQQGKRIDAESLLHFAAKPRRHGPARRLALELVDRLRPGTSRRLLPGWIDDPEFRYDAVDLLSEGAKELARTGAQEKAIASYRRAFQATDDVPQAQRLARQLKTLGASVNWSSPVFDASGKQILVSGTHTLRGYAMRDGQELWRVSGLQQECICSPVVQGDRVFAASGPAGLALAVRLNGGRGDLTQTNIVWRSRRGTPNIPSPLCLGEYYYQVNDQGIASCLNATTGAELWRERLRGTYHASPVAGDGKIYFTNLEGVTSVIQTGPKFQVLARCTLGETTVASPAIAQGQLFFRTEKHLYCIGKP